MNTVDELRVRLQAALPDPELRRLSPGLSAMLRLQVGEDAICIRFTDGLAALQMDEPGESIGIAAAATDWEQVLRVPPVPTFHSFTALQIANAAFSVTGAPKHIAQARPALERLMELVTATAATGAPSVARDITQITGRYAPMTAGAYTYEVYHEIAGQGLPVLFLHTAGADGRQYAGQMADTGLAQRFRMYAVDLPFHGKSMPPRNWDGAPYLLTADIYRDWCCAFIDQIIGEPAIVVGGSMGAAIALVLAAQRPNHLRGVVALEPPFQSRGRRNPYQNHVEVHGGLHNGAYVRGLMSPTSPIEDRRRASWIYAQGGPGVYPGDLAFYSDEFDGAVTAPQIDAARTPVALLSGTYDYSATPADGAKLAALISGSLHVVMDGLGHFPMTEHPDHFRSYLLRGLDHVTKTA